MSFCAISVKPFGLFMSLNSFAISLFGPMPAEKVIPFSSKSSFLISDIIFLAVPKSLIDPVRSRKTSSIENTSTTGVNFLQRFTNPLLVSVYRLLFASTKMR